MTQDLQKVNWGFPLVINSCQIFPVIFSFIIRSVRYCIDCERLQHLNCLLLDIYTLNKYSNGLHWQRSAGSNIYEYLYFLLSSNFAKSVVIKLDLSFPQVKYILGQILKRYKYMIYMCQVHMKLVIPF